MFAPPGQKGSVNQGLVPDTAADTLFFLAINGKT